MEIKMRITFFVGNGFDLNQSLRTSYPNFLKKYIIESKKDPQYVIDFKKRLVTFDCWSDLEIALGDMLCEYDENTIDDFINALKDLKEKLSLYLEKEEKRFKYKIRRNKKELRRSIAIFHSKQGYQYPFNDLYADNSEKNVINFVSFNYTRIVNKMIHKIRKKRLSLDWMNTENDIGTVLSVHGTTRTGFILGVNDISQIANPELRTNDKLIKHFIKKNQIDTMNKYSKSDKIADVINTSNVIYVYGMSIGKTDNAYWESICDWLNDDKNHLLIINRFDCHFSPIDMGTVSLNTNDFLEQLRGLGADAEALSNQVHYITNSTIFSFVKKAKGKRKG